MFKHPLFLLEFLLFDGLFLAWAAWELWTVRRSRDEKPKPETTSSPEGPGHPEG